MNWRHFIFGSRALDEAQDEAAKARSAALDAAFKQLDAEADRAIERAKRDGKEAADIRVGAASQHITHSPPTPEEPLQ